MILFECILYTSGIQIQMVNPLKIGKIDKKPYKKPDDKKVKRNQLPRKQIILTLFYGRFPHITSSGTNIFFHLP